MAEVGVAIASSVVGELINVVINYARAAVKCKAECKKLHEELVIIMPDVEQLEKRLAALGGAMLCGAHEDLQMVAAWLARLKKAMESAKNDVHKCNSGRLSFDQHKLSLRLTSHYNTITNLAQQRQSLFLHLGTLMQAPAQIPSQQTYRPPEDWHESPGTSVLRRMADERNDALHRADLHRQSLSAGSSLRSGRGSGHSGYESNESSSHSGYRSEADSSGHGGDSPRALRQREEQRRKAEADRQSLRRHTLASAFGHDPEPAYDKWKY